MTLMNDCGAAWPSLSTAADAICIHETYHPAHVVVARTAPFVSAHAAVAIFAAGGILVAGVSHLCDAAIGGVLFVYSLLSLPLVLAGIYSRAAQTRQAQERTLSLVDDVVTFTTTAEVEACPLEKCCWFYGEATDDPGLSFQNIRQKALLLVFPSGRTVACGLTRPFDLQWLDALRANECRKVLRQGGALGALVGTLAIVNFIGGACLGRYVGCAIRDAVFQAPQNNQFGNFLPALFCILGAWFGAVSPMFIPGWRRDTEDERQQFINFAVLLPAKSAILAGAVIGGNWATTLLLALVLVALLFLLTRFVCRVPWPD
jgi:hypothetical protein